MSVVCGRYYRRLSVISESAAAAGGRFIAMLLFVIFMGTFQVLVVIKGWEGF
jgi:hypothetical protein